MFRGRVRTAAQRDEHGRAFCPYAGHESGCEDGPHGFHSALEHVKTGYVGEGGGRHAHGQRAEDFPRGFPGGKHDDVGGSLFGDADQRFGEGGALRNAAVRRKHRVGRDERLFYSVAGQCFETGGGGVGCDGGGHVFPADFPAPRQGFQRRARDAPFPNFNENKEAGHATARANRLLLLHRGPGRRALRPMVRPPCAPAGGPAWVRSVAPRGWAIRRAGLLFL